MTVCVRRSFISASNPAESCLATNQDEISQHFLLWPEPTRKTAPSRFLGPQTSCKSCLQNSLRSYTQRPEFTPEVTWISQVPPFVVQPSGLSWFIRVLSLRPVRRFSKTSVSSRVFLFSFVSSQFLHKAWKRVSAGLGAQDAHSSLVSSICASQTLLETCELTLEKTWRIQ